MELNDAELYGIDLQELKQESFLHMGHVRMLREHNRRVEWWTKRQELDLRHTETNVCTSVDTSKITSNEKNGN